jgi:hypothetical protein
MTIRFRSLILIIVSALLIGLGLFKLYTIFHRPLTHHLNEDIQWLGLINLDHAPEIDLQSVMNGEDGVLVVDHTAALYQTLINKIPEAKYLNLDEVFNLSNLHLFDKNGDGAITAKDPIFQHLYIIKFYNKGNQSDIKSLAASGVKAIVINNTTPTGDRMVIMADGSQHTLIGTNKLEKTEAKEEKKE